MFCSAMEGVFPLLVVILLVIYLKKIHHMLFKPFFVGVLMFIVFAKILETILHLIVLQFDHATSVYLMTHPLAFTLYGGFAAGIFEETGRYFGFRVMLKRYRTWKAGISYGLGNGGIEAFLLGTVISVESIVFGVLNNSHQLPANIPASTLQQIQTLVHQPGSYYLFGTFERLMAICIQVALSLLVLYSVRERKVIFLFISVILHAMVDFVPGLYQSHVFPLWGVEGFMLIYGVLSILFIKKSQLLFSASNINNGVPLESQ